MTNPRTIDRRDVSHPTNPIGGHEHIEEVEDTSPAELLNTRAATEPASGRDARSEKSGGRETAGVVSPHRAN